MARGRRTAGGGEQLERSDRGRRYWALLPADELVPELKKRRKRFLDFWDQSGLYSRVFKSWHYYHGLSGPEGHYNDAGVQVAGDEGEVRLVKLNEFRSSLLLLKTYITSGKVEWDTLAQGEEIDALNAAKKGNNILDGYLQDSTNGLEAALAQAVEDSLVLTAGYVWPLWDPTHGEDDRGDVLSGQQYWRGEFRFLNPSVFDVAFDHTIRDFRECRWLDCRRQENRFDLAAEFEADPGLAERIFAVTTRDENSKYSKFDFILPSGPGKDDDHDFLWVHYLYVKPSPAAPRGRYVRYVGDIVLDDQLKLPDGHIPVHRVIPGQFLLTPFGFTPGFSAQAPQELLDMTASIIATNQNSLGSTKLWKKTGEPINRADIEPGVTLIECDTKPEALELLKTSPELYKSIEMYTSAVRNLVGTNDTARGETPKQVKSGAHALFNVQQAHQAASDLVGNFDHLLSEVGTSILTTLKHRGGKGRQVFIQSAFTRKRTVERFSAEDLEGVARVTVTKGNPLLRTLGGRIQVAEFLVDRQLVKTPEEFLTVIQTGNLSKLTETEDNQLSIVHQETEAFLQGNFAHVALPTDNQVLHIRKKAAILETAQARQDPQLAAAVYGAILEHMELLKDPMVQLLQVLLGYSPGPMVGLGAPAPAGGGGPKPVPEPGAGPQGGPPQLVGGGGGTAAEQPGGMGAEAA